MAMSFPLAWIQTLFSNVIARKVYSLVFGVIILQFCFSTGYASFHGVMRDGSTVFSQPLPVTLS